MYLLLVRSRIAGSTVPVADTIEAFDKIADGEYDHVAEQAFFMCGGLDNIKQKSAEDPEEPLMADSDLSGDKVLQVELVAADRLVWSGQATMVIARTTEGDIGILPNHAPLLSSIIEGTVVDGADHNTGRPGSRPSTPVSCPSPTTASRSCWSEAGMRPRDRPGGRHARTWSRPSGARTTTRRRRADTWAEDGTHPCRGAGRPD